MYDVTVIGCGICGASIAYALSHYDLRVLVLEKENDIAEGATKANSGIVHAGYDPLPGTLMAKLNCEGAAKMASLCKEFGISYTQCGSMVLAFDEKEDEMVRELLARGKENGVSHLSILSGDSVREAEPLVSMEVTSALFAPTAAVILPWELCLAFMRNAMNNGVTLMRNQEVQSISSAPLDHYIIQTASDTFASRYVVNAAGIQSDRIHNMVSSPDFEILPSRGEYALFDKNNHTPVKHVLFSALLLSGKACLLPRRSTGISSSVRPARKRKTEKIYPLPHLFKTVCRRTPAKHSPASVFETIYVILPVFVRTAPPMTF